MPTGVHNGVGPMQGHVQSGESLGHDTSLSQSTGVQRGRGELEGHDIEVSDGRARQEVLDSSKETQGRFSRWMSSLWNLGKDLANASHEFMVQMHPQMDDDVEEETVSGQDETQVPVQEPRDRQQALEDEFGPGEVDEDGTVWYDVKGGTEDEIGELHEIPISRQENLRMDKDHALLREGFRLKQDEPPKTEEHAPQQAIAPMSRGFLQKYLGDSCYAIWCRLTGRSTQPQPVEQDTRSISEKNLSKIEKLQIDTAKCLEKLNEQIKTLTGSEQGILDTETDLSRIPSDVSSLTLRDHAWRWGKTTQAAFTEAVSTLGWCTAGAGIVYGGTTLSSLTGGGISGQLVSVLGGSYLALSALRDLPGNVTDKAALKIIEESLVEINRLLSEAKNLSLQEIQRHELSGKMLTVSQGRMEKIERLELELEVIDLQVAKRKEPGLEPEVQQPRLPVTVSDGTARSETLSGLARAKQAFSSFFSPIVQGLSRAGRFLGDALGLTSLRVLQKADRAEDRAYEKTYARGLALLQSPAQDSVVSTQLLDKTAQRTLGLPPERPTDPKALQQRIKQIDRQSEAMKPVLRLGENIVRHVQKHSGSDFGTLIVTDKDDSRYVVNSGLPSVRAMCQYFDVLARDVGKDNALGVKVDDSGGLVLRDPDRSLYHFLFAAPQARTSLFTTPVGAGDKWLEATDRAGQMWIHDSTGQLPGGANRVVFETGVENGENVLKLRFERIDRDALVSAALDEPEHSMMAQLRLMYTAYRDAYRSGESPVDTLDDETLMQRYQDSNKRLGIAGEDYSQWPLDKLQARRELLLNRVAQEQVLLQRDNDSYQLLQNDSQMRVIEQRV